jgi:hypothetical protein
VLSAFVGPAFVLPNTSKCVQARNARWYKAKTYIFSVESEVAKGIADQLRAKLTGQEEQVITAKPTDNTQAYDAYLRGLAYSLKTTLTPGNFLGAQKYLKEAVQLDPKFALAWALLSDTESRGYLTQNLQPTHALSEDARPTPGTC